MSDSHVPESQTERSPSQRQFRLRTLFAITTAMCVLLAVAVALTPDNAPLSETLFIFVILAIPVQLAARRYYQSKQRPWTLTVETINVQVDAKWLRRVKSPIIFFPIAALTGVSITFAPAYLLWCGQLDEFGITEWIGVPFCFLVIYLVPGFYMSLASEVIAQLVKHQEPPASNTH